MENEWTKELQALILMIKNISTSVLHAVLFLIISTTSVHASEVYSFTGSTSYGGGYGNSMVFGDDDELTVTAWGFTGSGGTIQTGEISRWSTGLGACNRREGTAGNGCSTSSEHQVDNASYDDLVLFYFSRAVQFDQIRLDPWSNYTVDAVTYWIGTIDDDNLNGLGDSLSSSNSSGLLSKGFSSPVTSTFAATSSPVNVALAGIGNALLIGGVRDAASNDNDYFKIASLTVSAVPIPAAAPLFGGALSLLGFLSWRPHKRPQVVVTQ
ncbi:MAG: hypothetical protein KDI49_07255 [Gammaproteobacteria bacterium]|nr:hypothetical protein [Gammaproteobacteria bacterium]